MSDILSIRDLVNCWPTRAVMANDINDAAGRDLVATSQVHKWAEKQSIPAKYHHHIIKAAQGRGYPVTAELIVRLHANAEVA